MIAPDSSVLVAGYVVDHRFHDAAGTAVFEAGEGRLSSRTRWPRPTLC